MRPSAIAALEDFVHLDLGAKQPEGSRHSMEDGFLIEALLQGSAGPIESTSNKESSYGICRDVRRNILLPREQIRPQKSAPLTSKLAHKLQHSPWIYEHNVPLRGAVALALPSSGQLRPPSNEESAEQRLKQILRRQLRRRDSSELSEKIQPTCVASRSSSPAQSLFPVSAPEGKLTGRVLQQPTESYLARESGLCCNVQWCCPIRCLQRNVGALFKESLEEPAKCARQRWWSRWREDELPRLAADRRVLLVHALVERHGHTVLCRREHLA
mmetsp:Transcript_2238/g.5223  ORF Transcript_2238/g.5223 Transcript_2238/m.5223 type:complete len:271 (+) Transcript_2238:1330-2142(+)